METRKTQVLDHNTSARAKWAVCIDTSNSGQIEVQVGKLHSTEKAAIEVLRATRSTGQVVRVAPAK